MSYRLLQCFFLSMFTLVAVSSASAQSTMRRFDAGAQVVSAHLGQFDDDDLGFGGRFGWRPTGFFGVEAELTLFPSDFPSRSPFSQGRVEGLFGVTAGPSLGPVRPFARFRPGFLAVQESSRPIACILIFPPPLSCTLAGGRTLPVFDVGGGLEVALSRSLAARLDVGDRAVRYPGPVFDSTFTVRDKSFFAHELRIAAGAAFRF